MVVGRKREIKILNKMLASSSSELIAVFGRRRVGKTFLIREVYTDNFVFELTGLHNGNQHDQLQNFHSQIKISSKRLENSKAPRGWPDAFRLLEDYLDGLKSRKKKVIFIDEFPWIAWDSKNLFDKFELAKPKCAGRFAYRS